MKPASRLLPGALIALVLLSPAARALPEAEAVAGRKLLQQYADVVVHESPFTFPLDETAYSDGKPRVYASYNVEHRLAAQMLNGESGAAAASFIRFMEAMLVARADLVFATSEDERIQFAADFGADPAKIRLAPNGFEPEENPAASVAAVEKFRCFS